MHSNRSLLKSDNMNTCTVIAGLTGEQLPKLENLQRRAIRIILISVQLQLVTLGQASSWDHAGIWLQFARPPPAVVNDRR